MTKRVAYSGPLTDSSRWDSVALRPDDIIVVTPPKSGTTWMQTIIALLLSGDPEVDTELSIKMPWVDMRMRDLSEVIERLEAMPHRRSLKSHTPLDGLPLDDSAHYICVFRHPLDAHFSFRKHVGNLPFPVFDPWYPADDQTGATFQHFLTGDAQGEQCDAMPLSLILRHFTAAKAVADRPNVTLFHYADMKRDLPGTFEQVARLLGVRHAPQVMEQLVQAADFDNMKQNADRFCPSGGKGFFKSDSDFFDSGSSGKWQGQLSEKELADYDAILDAALSPKERRWLEFGTEEKSGL